jgi:hypothetical protein
MCKKLVYLICFVFVLGLVGSAGAQLPAPWDHGDVGTPLAGSVVYDSGTQSIAITANGHDIWNTSDNFHYVYQEWSGDCEMIARVASIVDGGNDWRKAGVMFRQSLTGPSKHVFMCITAGGGGGSSFQGRTNDGEESWNTDDGDATAFGPYWVRVTRVGNTFTGYTSPDGSDWKQIDSGTGTITEPFYVGLAVTAHETFEVTTATFDSVSGDVSFGPYPYPSSPVPPSGSEIDGYVYDVTGDIYAILSFTPGDFAVSHEAFFSDDAKVIARDPTVSLGEPGVPPTTYYVGLSIIPPYFPSLVRGTRYYWCADETDSNDVVWQGPVWSFYLRSDKASDPDPADGQRFVSLTPTLSWGGGVGVQEHDVYFGYTFAAVNDANMLEADPEFRGTQMELDTTWDPNADGGLTLDYLTDYYWRIDEVHGGRYLPLIPGIVIKGDVWKFTTIPEIPIEDPNLIAWWSLDEGEGDRALDWSGHDNHGTVNGGPEWVAGMIGNALDLNGSNQYVAITGFTEIQDLNDNDITICMWVKADDIDDEGMMWFTDETSGHGKIRCRVDAGNWQFRHGQGATGNNLNTTSPATAGVWTHFAGVRVTNDALYLYLDGMLADQTPFLVAGDAASNSWIGAEEGSDNYFDGIIDEVRIYDYALTESEIRRAAAPPEAWSPDPADGTNLVDPTEFVKCTWKAGGDAAQHRVYWCVGDDPNLLTLVATKPLAEPNYAPGLLAYETSYCWRVDEVNGIDVVTGNVWKFSTVREAGNGFHPRRGLDQSPRH